MTKVAFCDDELSMLNDIQVLLDEYRVKQNQEIEYTAFRSPLELLAVIERGIRFDVLFLDVLMPGENGIDTAAEIRHYDSNIKIIFLTSSAEFAVQSYAVNAFFYQLKPIHTESFFRVMDSVLDEYRVKQNREVEYTAFRSPFELLAVIERGIRFDVLLLDVLMPGENGIDTAAEIRHYDSNAKIIFLTSSAEFAVQSYAVNAFFYQLKPVHTESFFRVMDSVLEECEKEHTSSLILRCKSGITRVELKTLEYCEVIHRTLFLHLTSGKILESTGSLDELCSQLKSYRNFLRPHRSYLINLEYVQKLSARAITMSCLTEIPIPRGKYNEVKNTFLEYSFNNRRVIL